MLLAPVLGEPPRAVAERLGEALQQRAGGALDRVEVAGPGLPEPFPGRRLVPGRVDGVLAAGDALRPRATQRRAGPGRVRLRQPDRPADRGVGPPRRVRRRAGALLEMAGHDGPARVLLQRRRRPDPAPRRLDPGPRARRGAARGRLPGRVRRRVAAQIPDAAPRDAGRARRGGRRDPDGGDPRDARALPRRASTPGSWSASLYEGAPSAWERARDELARPTA